MRNKIFMIVSFLVAFIGLNSCLKDNVGIDWAPSLVGKMYAEFPNPGPQAFSIQPVATDQIFKFLINIATDALPTSDITLKLKIDTVAMNAYSDQVQEADTSIHWRYKLYPYLTILDSVLTIKAGTRNSYVHVDARNANLISLSDKFMAPVTIASVSGNVVIASNMCTVLYKLPLANKWEGTYSMNGSVLRAGDAVLSGSYTNRIYKLATTGPNNVTLNQGMAWADASTDYCGGISYWTITISEATVPNPITVTDATNPAVTTNPAYYNRYDPATKTFYISVYWGSGPTNRATTDTLLYIGPY
jgi:hypothetical protein